MESYDRHAQRGARVRYQGHRGTIRFHGPVAGTKGTWLGIEWDDPARGKHDGSKDGVRYFECTYAARHPLCPFSARLTARSTRSVPGAGSFLRPSPQLELGTSFTKALSGKYVEDFQGSQEKVVLGSSASAIVVEAVNLDMIRGNLARLETLREVSLDDVCEPDAPGVIRRACPSVYESPFRANASRVDG
jgi:hypothetical protein